MKAGAEAAGKAPRRQRQGSEAIARDPPQSDRHPLAVGSQFESTTVNSIFSRAN